MGCRHSKPKGGTHDYPTQPVVNIVNAGKVSHRPRQASSRPQWQQQPQPQPHRPQQQRPAAQSQQRRPAAQNHQYQQGDTDGNNAYDDTYGDTYDDTYDDRPVASQPQSQYQPATQQKHNPYANDPQYKRTLDVAQSVSKVGAAAVKSRMGPNGQKYGALVDQGAQRGAQAATRKAMELKELKAAQAQKKGQGQPGEQAPAEPKLKAQGNPPPGGLDN